MSVSVAIQAHPLRREMAERLASECIGGDVDVVYDPEPDGYRSPWRTYRLALERGEDAPAGTSHRLIVQDDVFVCDHFLEVAEAAAASQPGRVLVLFVAGRPFPQVAHLDHARKYGRSWAELDGASYCPVVATAWPVGLIRPMLDWVEGKRYPPQMTADDELCGRYLREVAVVPLASVPSLVEHADSVFSIASGGRRGGGGHDQARRAHYFVEDDDLDPRSIDWTLGPVGPYGV